MEEARKVAESEGIALNQLFNVAVAEKLAILRTEKYYEERIRRAERSETQRVPDLSGIRNPPVERGGLPPDLERAGEIGKAFGRATPQFGKLKRRLERARGR